MSKKMQLRNIANRKAAADRRARLKEQREARQRMEWELLKLKLSGVIAHDFPLTTDRDVA